MYLFCKRCGRKLSSEVSRQRGYGSYCYMKVDEKRDKENIEEKEEKEIKNEEEQ